MIYAFSQLKSLSLRAPSQTPHEASGTDTPLPLCAPPGPTDRPPTPPPLAGERRSEEISGHRLRLVGGARALDAQNQVKDNRATPSLSGKYLVIVLEVFPVFHWNERAHQRKCLAGLAVAVRATEAEPRPPLDLEWIRTSGDGRTVMCLFAQVGQ